MKTIKYAVLGSVLATAGAQDLFLAAKSEAGAIKASVADLARAQTTKHTGKVSGKSTAEIASKINKHLEKSVSNLKECQSFSHEELNGIVRKMSQLFVAELGDAYAEKDLRNRREKSLEDFEKRWSSEDPEFQADPESAEALREAKCAEVLMLWAHHVPQMGKEALRDVALPRLPEFNFDRLKQSPKLAARYTNSYTCVTGHNMRAGHTSDHKWPHWPLEAHYHGRGHCAYPFWLGASGSCQPGAAIEVWWSEKQLAEKFYHTSCSMSEAGASKDGPCYHLMLGGQPNPTAYLYTEKEDFCCVSGPTSTRAMTARRLQSGPGGTEKLAAPSSDFMDNMTDSGEMDFKGDFYTGKVKKYIMTLPDTEAVTSFWYLTTPDGKPVEQGEGGLPTKNDKPESVGAGILLWHEYNTSSFESVTLDASVFAVPDVCKKTYTSCTFP
jgi:hypothetical protein